MARGSSRISKFKPGPPDGHEGMFVKVGGQGIFYLTVCYFNLSLKYLDMRRGGLYSYYCSSGRAN